MPTCPTCGQRRATHNAAFPRYTVDEDTDDFHDVKLVVSYHLEGSYSPGDHHSAPERPDVVIDSAMADGEPYVLTPAEDEWLTERLEGML